MLDVRVATLDISKVKKTPVLFAFSGAKLAPQAAEFDKAHKGQIAKMVKQSGFKGNVGQTLYLTTPGFDVDGVLLVGLGKQNEVDAATLRKAGMSTAKTLEARNVPEATVFMNKVDKVKTDPVEGATAFMEGLELRLYKFTAFKSKKDDDKGGFKKLTVMTDRKYVSSVKDAATLVAAQTHGANLARDLVNTPANVANAEYLAAEAKKLKDLGVEVTVMGQKELEKEGLDMLLSVNHASDNEPQLIIMKWNGAGKDAPVRALVGKGVTYDTGGYSIKPSNGMVGMKADMAGAAAVIGTMKSIAGRKSKVNVVAACGCVENMINGHGNRPSDVVTAYNGKTVEINNTDAEGRLVLGDALAYLIDKEKPAEIIDIATLTGACMVALGAVYAGVFTNTPAMAKKMGDAGDGSGERVWHLPVGPEYTKMLESKVADLSNIGGQWGGACTAAAFLQEFVGKTKWAHLDIAGVGMADKIPGGLDVNGASGFGVRLLTRYLES